jgi:hypothetical protein
MVAEAVTAVDITMMDIMAVVMECHPVEVMAMLRLPLRAMQSDVPTVGR